MTDEYLRMLDSLARYYNSQITVHAGYLLTSIVVIFGAFALVKDVLVAGIKWALSLTLGGLVSGVDPSLFVTVGIFPILLILYFVVPLAYPVCFQYFLGRTQFYICLSETAWEHMGITSSDPDYFKEMRMRAIGDSQTGKLGIGIRQSIHSTFEARLYISECRRTQQKPKDEKPHVDEAWKEAFYLGESNHMCQESNLCYFGQKILGYNKTKLLLRAYNGTLKNYVQQYHKWIEEKSEKDKEPIEVQRGRLFAHFVDC